MATAASAEPARSTGRTTPRVAEHDLVNQLVDKLGTRLVAYVVSKDASTVNRWKSGKNTPDDEALRKLWTAYSVFQLLEDAESDLTIRAWFIGINPQLDDASPAEELVEGSHRDVMAAARAFLAGG